MLSIDVFSQSISSTANGYSVTITDVEKVIKTSSTLIKAKEDIVWSTNIGTSILWKSTYNKTDKTYSLYKGNVLIYSSSTISGIRSKYASELLGRNVNVQ
jgi:hypothetical protein